MNQTNFEKDLEAYFPDIYAIHVAGKFDKYIWDVFTTMLSMMHDNSWGEIRVIYQNGKINRIVNSLVTTANKGKAPNLTHPNVMDEDI